MSTNNFAQVHRNAEEQGVEFIDLKMLDLTGRLHHITFPFSRFTPDVCVNGIGFDGSSYGFLKVENSDMVLIPDLATACTDPFRIRKTLTMFAEAHLADTGRSSFLQDSRTLAKRAEKYLLTTGFADLSQWAPEYEFHVFEEASFKTEDRQSMFAVRSGESFYQNAYHACNPYDRYDDFRDEVCACMADFQIPVRYHHHEVGAQGQQEIEGWFSGLTATGDNAVLTKYILFNLAERHGLKVTFMPKPLFGNAGSGWHLHQFLQKNGKNIFNDGEGYGGLSKTALFYIGGILSHADALCALTNPSTNSFKRLVPGFEAPTVRTFGRSNRGAAIRIPTYVTDPELRRIEYRPPDLTANPYLCCAAIMMAGIDGVLNQIDPIAAGYAPEDAPSDTGRQADFLPRSLDDSLDALENDHSFLLQGEVFPSSLVRRWLEIKREEIADINRRPHPYEFTMYFDF